MHCAAVRASCCYGRLHTHVRENGVRISIYGLFPIMNASCCRASQKESVVSFSLVGRSISFFAQVQGECRSVSNKVSRIVTSNGTISAHNSQKR